MLYYLLYHLGMDVHSKIVDVSGLLLPASLKELFLSANKVVDVAQVK